MAAISHAHPLMKLRSVDLEEVGLRRAGSQECHQPAGDFMQDRGGADDRIALCVPDLLVDLIKRKSWHRLLVQQRWGAGAGIKHIIPNWPPESWRPAERSTSAPGSVDFSWYALGHLVQTITEIAESLPVQPPPAALIEEDAEDMGRHDVRGSLGRVAATLQAWQNSLEGKKMTDAAQKASAMAHAFALENPSWAQLHEYLDSFVSITTDLGTESSLAYFHVNLKDLFPPWHDLEPLEADADDIVMHLDRAEAPAEDVPRQRYFLPNALPIMGMQHCVHNLLKEAHTSLTGWSEFWQDLKNLESLLNWPFRRRRLIVTCIRCSPLHHMEEAFSRFSQSLYEPRWHEVASFIAKLGPLLGPLRSVWDPQRFEQGGVDVDGGPLSSAPAGAAAFDPHALTRCLQSAKFAAYVVLVARLDQCPEELVSWAEACYCHECILQGLKQHQKHQVLKEHFAAVGGCSCPMAGKRAPELAAGHLETVFNEMCQQALAGIFLDMPLPLSAADQTHIISELQRAQNHVKLALFAKLQHWQRMPWLACGLAHHEESVARRVACDILASFDQCSEPELHHRLTQQFLTEPLHADLVRFANGAAFSTLSAGFQSSVVRLHFVPVVESIIESKHAVSTRLHKRDTHAGPVMVSLHNRMVILERRLEFEKRFLNQLAMKLSGARHLGSTPVKLGLHRHPLLVELENVKGRRAVAAHLQKPLTAIIYRTDLEGQYKPLKEARGQHNAFHKKNESLMSQALQDRAQSGSAVAVVPQDQVRHSLILDHFRAVASCSTESAVVFSLPIDAGVSVQPLSEFFSKPEGRLGNHPSGRVEPEAEGASHLEHVFFTMTKARPSANHHLYVHPGAGQSLKSSHVAVALHPSQAVADPGQFSVACEGSGEHGRSDNIALLNTLCSRPSDLETHLQQWSVQPTLEYSTRSGNAQVKQLLTHMISLSYFVEEGDFYVPHPEMKPVAERLCGEGVLQRSPFGGYALLRQDLSKLTLHWKIKDPEPVCAARSHLALEDHTAYELLLKLEGLGFTWRQWPSSQKQRQLALPYSPGKDKLWYSTRAMPPQAYFLALVKAEDIVAAGVHTEIPHGRDRKVYEAILAGEPLPVQMVRGRKRAAIMDADAELPLPLPALPDKPRRQRQRREPTEAIAARDGDNAAEESCDDAMGAVAAVAADDVGHATDVVDHASNSGSAAGTDDLNERLLALFEDAPCEEDPAAAEPDQVPAASLGSDVGVERREVVGPGALNASGSSSPAPPAPPVPAQAAAEARVIRRRPRAEAEAEGDEGGLVSVRRLLSSSRWGVFRITPKQPKSKGGGTYGGYEGTCPFHKKNELTSCKKFCGIRGPEESDRDLAFRQVLYWCCQARDFSRQRDHLRATLHPTPAMPILISRRIDDPPAGEVKNDDELDAEDEAAVRRANRAAGSRAKAKASKAKAKPKAKVAAKAEARHASASSSSSSSSKSGGSDNRSSGTGSSGSSSGSSTGSSTDA
ncbi:unnamed protein product [Symbiodinium sp. KB8]|nr:unnamed protein product [Symbiodinium sp. KB8]